MNHSAREYEDLAKGAIEFAVDGPSMTASDRDGVRDMAQIFATLAVAAAIGERDQAEWERHTIRMRAGI